MYMYIYIYIYIRLDLQKHACNMYVTRLTLGLSPAKAQLVDEHSVFGGEEEGLQKT